MRLLFSFLGIWYSSSLLSWCSITTTCAVYLFGLKVGVADLASTTVFFYSLKSSSIFCLFLLGSIIMASVSMLALSFGYCFSISSWFLYLLTDDYWSSSSERANDAKRTFFPCSLLVGIDESSSSYSGVNVPDVIPLRGTNIGLRMPPVVGVVAPLLSGVNDRSLKPLGITMSEWIIVITGCDTWISCATTSGVIVLMNAGEDLIVISLMTF